MDYGSWTRRERRIRLKILKDSPTVREMAVYRVCKDCGEICLCHEQTCPNCNGTQILEKYLPDTKVQLKERIRCRFRFDNLS